MKTSSRGFTLVELAIVLVIIGLLMGGILKGQELINGARVKSMANDFRAVASAYYGYLDRFHAVPGDDLAAVSHVGATSGHVGDGNGRINGWWIPADPATNESSIFWEHVRRANLLTGSTVVAAGYGPVNAGGGQIGVTGTNPDSTDPSTFGATFYVCSNNIEGRSAKQIDIMLDDGNPATGSVRVFPAGSTAATDPRTLAQTLDATLFAVCVAY